MINPYRRLLEATGMSQRQFAKYADMSLTALTYVLTGQPGEISEWQNNQMARACLERGVDAKAILRHEYGGQALGAAYQQWRIRDREDNADVFRLSLSSLRSDAPESPFAQFITRTTGSQQAFCKQLHVPPSHVHRFAEGKTLTMPGEIRDALLDVGHGNGWLTELQRMQDDWRLT